MQQDRSSDGDNSWRFYAECAKQVSLNPELQDLWFPDEDLDPEENALNTELAQAICSMCPVRQKCFTWARETGQPTGVWGGIVFPVRKRRSRKGDSDEQ